MNLLLMYLTRIYLLLSMVVFIAGIAYLTIMLCKYLRVCFLKIRIKNNKN